MMRMEWRLLFRVCNIKTDVPVTWWVSRAWAKENKTGIAENR